MDERWLTEMFAEAAEQAQRNAPLAGFDHDAVLAGSRGATERARRWRIGATAIAVLAVAGAGLSSIRVLGTSAGHPTTLAAPASAPEIAQRAAPPGALVPFGARKRLATDSCAQPDQALFRELTAALPAATGAVPRPLADDAQCPKGARGVEIDVNDRGARGVLRVLLSPPGAGGINVSGSGGSVYTTSTNASGGGQLTVSVTTDDPGRIPFSSRLNQLAHTLARMH
jgi:hypothetical protein